MTPTKLRERKIKAWAVVWKEDNRLGEYMYAGAYEIFPEKQMAERWLKMDKYNREARKELKIIKVTISLPK